LSVHLTPYQSQYIAWQLSRRMGADSADLLATTLVDAQVDLNPHQVEAALFAFRSPLSKGVILADEVGLGKTIEAGLVIAQRWAERGAASSSSPPPTCASSGTRSCRTSSACRR
jgi:SNF2 family DNA or RNA helicase